MDGADDCYDQYSPLVQLSLYGDEEGAEMRELVLAIVFLEAQAAFYRGVLIDWGIAMPTLTVPKSGTQYYAVIEAVTEDKESAQSPKQIHAKLEDQGYSISKVKSAGYLSLAFHSGLIERCASRYYKVSGRAAIYDKCRSEMGDYDQDD